MHPTKLNFGSRDIISSLPEALISRILSFLPIEESALTSVLSKEWRNLFAFTPNLDFDASAYRHPPVDHEEMKRIIRKFMSFVDRVLRLQENSTVNKFSLTWGRVVNPDRVVDWISNVLERGVSDLYICVSLDLDKLPSKVFVSKSLVSLKIEAPIVNLFIHVEDIFLPKLKTLCLSRVMFDNADDCFDKLTSGCPVLEEFALKAAFSDHRSGSMTSKTIKRLSLCSTNYDKNTDSISFDMPNLVHLEYYDFVAEQYPKVNFDSLVEASILVRTTCDQIAHANPGHATNFLMGIRNVEILYLYYNTLEVLTLCCEPIPVFNNLIHLTIDTNHVVGWESLPALLNNSPNLETLVFQGLQHKETIKCQDVDGCICNSAADIRTCLSSSPVRVLKIKFSRFLSYGYDVSKQKQVDQVKYFLETMPNLEQVILHYNTSTGEHFVSQLQMLIPSSKCSVQLVCDK